MPSAVTAPQLRWGSSSRRLRGAWAPAGASPSAAPLGLCMPMRSTHTTCLTISGCWACSEACTPSVRADGVQASPSSGPGCLDDMRRRLRGFGGVHPVPSRAVCPPVPTMHGVDQGHRGHSSMTLRPTSGPFLRFCSLVHSLLARGSPGRTAGACPMCRKDVHPAPTLRCGGSMAMRRDPVGLLGWCARERIFTG